MCDGDGDYYYADYVKCVKYYTVVMNHMITNKLDELCFYTLFIMMFALFMYQCQKIHYQSQHHSQKIYIQFQLLFLFLSLVRVCQTFYGVIGYQIDQRPQGWEIEQGVFLYYCDRIFVLDGDICRVRYELQGLFTDISVILTNYVIQNIALFWFDQSSPYSILTINIINKSNRYMKAISICFLSMNVALFVLTIIACSYSYSESILTRYAIYQNQSLQISQIVATFITFLSFIISFRRSYLNNHHGKEHFIIVSILIFVVILRITYLLIRIFDIDQEYIRKHYEKSTLQQNIHKYVYIRSLLYFTMNTICEFTFRLCLVKLF